MNAKIGEAEKNLESVQQDAPKIGTSLAKYKAEKAAWQEKVDKAQAAVDFWNGVKAAQDKRIAEEREREAQPVIDAQGNPLNEDGSLKVERINSIDELTDEDFTKPTRNVELPQIPTNVDAAIGAEGKPVVIKKNIFEKNAKAHQFSADESRAQ